MRIECHHRQSNLDAIVSSTGGSCHWRRFAGYPYITVPAGIIDGIPVGSRFFWKGIYRTAVDKTRLCFEQITKMRQTPKFLPN